MIQPNSDSSDKILPKVADEHHDSHRSLIRSTSLISMGTLSSRILGFLRDVVLAKLLGTGFRADAFFVALKIPNLFRDLVGEGAMNAALVPMFSRYHQKKSREEFWRFVSVILAIGLILLTALTLIGILAAPWIVRLIAPGFMADPEKLDLTVKLTRVMFPYLLFIGLTAYCMGVLYTFRKFLVPAFSPCLLNISIIVAAFIASRNMNEPVYGLAIGVLIGGVLQLMVQIPALKRTGFRLFIPKTLNHPGALKIGRLLIPRVIGSGVYQLTVLLDTFCASLAMIVGAGGISAIYYANRIIQFPMGIFSVALASAVLPSISGLAHKKDMAAVKKMMMFAIENIFFIMCPTTILLMFLSEPVIRVLFQRGEFGTYSTDITSWALAFYSIGLFSFGGIKILVAGFHAMQDTKTPVMVAAGCLILNAVLNVILMFPFKVGGIALASALAGTIDFVILYKIMDRRLGGFEASIKTFAMKVIAASGCLAVYIYYAWNFLPLRNEALKLGAVGISAYIIYILICDVLKVHQAGRIKSWITQKF